MAERHAGRIGHGEGMEESGKVEAAATTGRLVTVVRQEGLGPRRRKQQQQQESCMVAGWRGKGGWSGYRRGVGRSGVCSAGRQQVVGQGLGLLPPSGW